MHEPFQEWKSAELGASCRSSSKEKSPGKSQSKSEKRGVDDVEAAPVAATVEREWQPTRSVLQQGARETGVKVGDHQPGQGLR